MEAGEHPLSAAVGSRVSAADADSADRREGGAENANTFLPQSIGGFARRQKRQREI